MIRLQRKVSNEEICYKFKTFITSFYKHSVNVYKIYISLPSKIENIQYK